MRSRKPAPCARSGRLSNVHVKHSALERAFFARSLFCAEALHAGTRFFEANDAAVILAKLNDTIGYKLHRQAVLQR